MLLLRAVIINDAPSSTYTRNVTNLPPPFTIQINLFSSSKVAPNGGGGSDSDCSPKRQQSLDSRLANIFQGKGGSGGGSVNNQPPHFQSSPDISSPNIDDSNSAGDHHNHQQQRLRRQSNSSGGSGNVQLPGTGHLKNILNQVSSVGGSGSSIPVIGGQSYRGQQAAVEAADTTPTQDEDLAVKKSTSALNFLSSFVNVGKVTAASLQQQQAPPPPPPPLPQSQQLESVSYVNDSKQQFETAQEEKHQQDPKQPPDQNLWMGAYSPPPKSWEQQSDSPPPPPTAGGGLASDQRPPMPQGEASELDGDIVPQYKPRGSRYDPSQQQQYGGQQQVQMG